MGIPRSNTFLFAISKKGKLNKTANKAVTNNAGAILYDFIFRFKDKCKK